MALNKRNKIILCGLLVPIMIFGIVLMFTPSQQATYKMILINDTETNLMVGHDQSGNTIITLKPDSEP